MEVYKCCGVGHLRNHSPKIGFSVQFGEIIMMLIGHPSRAQLATTFQTQFWPAFQESFCTASDWKYIIIIIIIIINKLQCQTSSLLLVILLYTELINVGWCSSMTRKIHDYTYYSSFLFNSNSYSTILNFIYFSNTIFKHNVPNKNKK